MSNKNFIKCIKDYEKIREDFNNIITILNAYICYIRKRDKDVYERIQLPKENVILNQFIKRIEVDRIETKSIKDIKDIQKILNDNREINEGEILVLAKEFEKLEKKELVFRGKFEVYFLKKYVEDLVGKVNRKEYFEEYEKIINININNNTITYLSTYADTPEKLKSFLLEIKKGCNNYK